MVRPCSLRPPHTPALCGMTEVARVPDVDEENGTLVVLPGLHKQGTLALENARSKGQGLIRPVSRGQASNTGLLALKP